MVGIRALPGRAIRRSAPAHTTRRRRNKQRSYDTQRAATKSVADALLEQPTGTASCVNLGEEEQVSNTRKCEPSLP